jgi:hypothetical protein
MPKKANTKKAASAQYQNILALAEAASGAEGMVYLSVQKVLGNSAFVCANALGERIVATPRSLFTRGSMRISVGSIVVAAEPTMPAWKKELLAQQRAEHLVASQKAKRSGGAEPEAPTCLPYEIVGVVTERSEARRLIKAKMLPQSVLDQALAAEGGSAAKGEATELDDAVEFMTPEEVARQELLASGVAGSGLELEELSEHRGKDDGHHASRGMKQARMAAEARASIQQRLEALLNGTKKAAADVKLGALVEEEDAPLVAGSGPTRFKQFRPKKTEEEKEAQRAAAAAAAAEAAAALRSAQELDDIITGLMGSAAPEPDVATQVAALRAELEAMGEVEDWEQAADAITLEEL